MGPLIFLQLYSKLYRMENPLTSNTSKSGCREPYVSGFPILYSFWLLMRTSKCRFIRSSHALASCKPYSTQGDYWLRLFTVVIYPGFSLVHDAKFRRCKLEPVGLAMALVLLRVTSEWSSCVQSRATKNVVLQSCSAMLRSCSKAVPFSFHYRRLTAFRQVREHQDWITAH